MDQTKKHKNIIANELEENKLNLATLFIFFVYLIFYAKWTLCLKIKEQLMKVVTA